MKLAISASESDIIGFQNSLNENLAATHTVISFDITYGGLFGSVYSILQKNHEAVQHVSEIARKFIMDDKIQAEQTIKHNEDVVLVYREKLKRTENNIIECEKELSISRAELKNSQRELSRARAVSAPADNPEARRRVEQQASYAAQRVHNCAARCTALEEIGQLNNYKHKLQTAIEEIEQANKTLKDILYNILSEERNINEYTDRCTRIMNDIERRLSEIHNLYFKLKTMHESYSEIAVKAEEIVRHIDFNLSQAAETLPDSYKKIKIASSQYLYEMSNVLLFEKEKIKGENYAVTELMATISSLLQDNVIRSSVSGITEVRDVIEDRVADLDEKSKCFNRAARLLDEYIKL